MAASVPPPGVREETPVVRMLTAEPLTPEAFAPFGDVVSAGLRSGTSANQGTAVRFDRAAALESTRPGARPNLAVFRVAPQALPFVVRLLERHLHSSQAFLPMVCARFLVCVAPSGPDGMPAAESLRAFVCVPGQGINYRAGVWHHPIIALDAAAEFAMLAWEDGSSADCEEVSLGAQLSIAVAG
jgi:ureidoglycolate lyase